MRCQHLDVNTWMTSFAPSSIPSIPTTARLARQAVPVVHAVAPQMAAVTEVFASVVPAMGDPPELMSSPRKRQRTESFGFASSSGPSPEPQRWAVPAAAMQTVSAAPPTSANPSAPVVDKHNTPAGYMGQGGEKLYGPSPDAPKHGRAGSVEITAGPWLAGREISVWWWAERSHFVGTVTEWDPSDGTARLNYADGDVHWHDLSEFEWTLVGSQPPKAATQHVGVPDMPGLVAKNGPASSAASGGAPGAHTQAAANELHIGARVAIEGYSSLGTLAFIGEHAFGKGARCGVVLDEPVGKNDGIVSGHTYFQCRPGYGLLVIPRKVSVVDQGVGYSDVQDDAQEARAKKAEAEQAQDREQEDDEEVEAGEVPEPKAVRKKPLARQNEPNQHKASHQAARPAAPRHTSATKKEKSAASKATGGNQDAYFVCGACPKRFSRKDQLIQHFAVHLREVDVQKEPELNPQANGAPELPRRSTSRVNSTSSFGNTFFIWAALSWMCGGIRNRRVLLSPVCA